MAEVLTIHPDRIAPRLIARAAKILERGGLGVVPTDTGYAIVCGTDNRAGVKRLHRIKNAVSDDSKKPLSVLFPDLSTIADYVHGLPNPVFRVLRRTLPGPYTFILKASKRLSAASLKGRNTLGIRVPDHPVTRALLLELCLPLLATSAKSPGLDMSMIDPLDVSAEFGGEIDFVLDVGPLFPEPSTVVDFTSGEAEIVREGKGSIDHL